MIKKLYQIYNIIAGILLLVALLDRYAGKILKVIDPTFKKMLESKIPKQDKATTIEEILYVLKSDGSVIT